MSLVDRKCAVCGKNFQARSADIDRGYGETCSRSCGSIKRETEKKGNAVETTGEYWENELDYNPYEDV